MFESTLPFGTPDLIRVSAYRRYLDETSRSGDGDVGTSRLSSLNPSLAEDLMRFEQARKPGVGLELLEVMAACVRHSRSLLLQLQEAERVVPLTVFPSERLVHCPLRLETLLAGRLTDLQVMHVEPAVLRPPGHPDLSLVGDPDAYAPLGPLLWELAMRGARDELLPEISGMAAYRISPGRRAPEASDDQPARDLGVAGLRPHACDPPAQRPVPAGRADGDAHAPGREGLSPPADVQARAPSVSQRSSAVISSSSIAAWRACSAGTACGSFA